MRLDCFDLYLLHWRGSVPLAETVRGFEQLQGRGWVRLWGVSNFDLEDMRELHAVAQRDRVTPAQVALARALRQPGVMVIPKAGNALHLRHNWAAQSLVLRADDLAELDRLFPPPAGPRPLASFEKDA